MNGWLARNVLLISPPNLSKLFSLRHESGQSQLAQLHFVTCGCKPVSCSLVCASVAVDENCCDREGDHVIVAGLRVEDLPSFCETPLPAQSVPSPCRGGAAVHKLDELPAPLPCGLLSVVETLFGSTLSLLRVNILPSCSQAPLDVDESPESPPRDVNDEASCATPDCMRLISSSSCRVEVNSLLPLA